jgi:hypothetical protein
MNIVKTLESRATLDTSMLHQRECAGDPLNQPRDLLFAFHAKCEKQARALARFAEDNAYGRAQAFPDQDDWRAEITIFTPATSNVLHSLSALMLCLAQLYHLDYVGWSCIPQQPAIQGEVPHHRDEEICARHLFYGRLL